MHMHGVSPMTFLFAIESTSTARWRDFHEAAGVRGAARMYRYLAGRMRHVLHTCFDTDAMGIQYGLHGCKGIQ